MAVLTASKVIGEPGDETALSSLLDGARSGRSADHERLVARMQGLVRRWAGRLTDDADAADDVAQEVLIGLERRIHKFSGRSRFSTWLFAVTRRVALTHRKRERRHVGNAVPVDEALLVAPEAEVDHDKQALATLVLRYFDALPPKQRQIFEAVDIHGEEPAEVARRLGMPQVTVRANLFKARRSIRTKMLANHERLLKEYRG